MMINIYRLLLIEMLIIVFCTCRESKNQVNENEKIIEVETNYVTDTISLSQFVLVPGGRYTQGCKSNDKKCFNNEKPPIEVDIDSFYMSKFEVTQEQWQIVMGNNPSEFSGCPKCPVENISLRDINVYLNSLNKKSQIVFRLPTESEWEYAASYVDTFIYSGSNRIKEVAWYWQQDEGEEKTFDVGTKQPNSLGIFDMSGNVWEWTSSEYNGFKSLEKKSCKGCYTIRGGSFGNPAVACRITRRFGVDPARKMKTIGFRICYSII